MTPHATAKTREPALKSDKLYMENTLLRVAGALFSHDQKRAASRTGTIELKQDVADKRIVIRPDPKLGQPGPLAHKVFVALMKKYSDYGTPIQNQISFTQRELGRLIGRADFGGRDSEALARALHEIHYAFVRACFKRADKKYIEDSFNIFSRLIIERREFPTDPVEACTITLADPIVASLKDAHFTCLNYFLMQRLGTIGQALYMRLFFHLASIYETNKSRRQLQLNKHYGDICAEWLGGIEVRKHKSLVIRDQLGPHLEQLVAAKFLASYAIDKARTRDGLTITFKPGTAFFVDYDRYYRRKLQGNLQFKYHGDRHDLHEPMQIAALFLEKRTGRNDTVANVIASDVEVAREFITLLGYDQAPKFIDYALACAKRTKFDVQRLAGLRQYVPGFQQQGQQKVAANNRRADDDKERAGREEHARYESWLGAETKKRMNALSKTERGRIEARVRAHYPADAMPALVAIGVKVALQRHVNAGHPLPDFQAWRQRHAS